MLQALLGMSSLTFLAPVMEVAATCSSSTSFRVITNERSFSIHLREELMNGGVLFVICHFHAKVYVRLGELVKYMRQG